MGKARLLAMFIADMLEHDLSQEGWDGARARQNEKYSLGNKVRDCRAPPPRRYGGSASAALRDKHHQHIQT